MMVDVSVILPVYNEGKVLRRSVAKLETTLSDAKIGDFEIIISENGSTDDTVQTAKSLEGARIRVLHERNRLGKGAAIRSAAEYSKGEVIIFMDADLASEPDTTRELVSFINNGADIVIGSRYHPESKTKRDPVRIFASKGFNWMVREAFGSKLLDHQCGFKSFRKQTVLPILDEIHDQRWFWDTEFLIRAQRKGLKIKEIPVVWIEAKDSRFHLFRDSVQMLGAMLIFKIRGR
jgi:glycosyltransferase involved in cell wall biosynthesis